jgi:hypothetical protein
MWLMARRKAQSNQLVLLVGNALCALEHVQGHEVQLFAHFTLLHSVLSHGKIQKTPPGSTGSSFMVLKVLERVRRESRQPTINRSCSEFVRDYPQAGLTPPAKRVVMTI